MKEKLAEYSKLCMKLPETAQIAAAELLQAVNYISRIRTALNAARDSLPEADALITAVLAEEAVVVAWSSHPGQPPSSFDTPREKRLCLPLNLPEIAREMLEQLRAGRSAIVLARHERRASEVLSLKLLVAAEQEISLRPRAIDYILGRAPLSYSAPEQAFVSARYDDFRDAL